MSLRKIWAVALKELRQSLRDPLTLLLLLGMPAMMLLLYGYAISFDVRHVSLAVQDRDHSAASRELIASFVNSTYFDLVSTPPAGANLERLTEERQARAVLVIPEDYARDLEAGRRAQVQFLLDGSDSNTATAVLGYASSIVNETNARRAASSTGVAPGSTGIEYRPRVWYNPELQSTQFLVPGLIGFILMLTAVLSTALSVVREKERGTMEQLRVTSLRPLELIAGKTIPYLAVSIAATAIILVAARALFGVVVHGSYVELFVATFIYLVGALGFGLLVSSFSTTQAMAFQVGIVTSMLPAIFLSGFIFPIRAMPVAIQAITYLVPARYFLVVLRGLILKGAPLATYAGLQGERPEMPFLVLYAVAVMGLAYVRIARREA